LSAGLRSNNNLLASFFDIPSKHVYDIEVKRQVIDVLSPNHMEYHHQSVGASQARLDDAAMLCD